MLSMTTHTTVLMFGEWVLVENGDERTVGMIYPVCFKT